MPRTSPTPWTWSNGGAEGVFVAAPVTRLSRAVLASRRRPRHHIAMNNNDNTRRSGWRWLTVVVLVHLAVSVVHGTAHSGAHVPLSRAANLFVFGVIVAGPLVGLAVATAAARIGSSVIAITMAGAFVFGCVNHFVLAGPDHVSQVAEQWRAMFAT